MMYNMLFLYQNNKPIIKLKPYTSDIKMKDKKLHNKRHKTKDIYINANTTFKTKYIFYGLYRSKKIEFKETL